MSESDYCGTAFYTFFNIFNGESFYTLNIIGSLFSFQKMDLIGCAAPLLIGSGHALLSLI